MSKIFTGTSGKCYFNDGHIENILNYIHYSEENIIFYTESGKYEYRLWVEPADKEMLWVDNNPRILLIPQHAFYIHTASGPMIADIDKIEIK